MIRYYESFDEYIKSKDGLNDLHAIYGKCCLPVLACIDDLKLRCVWIEKHKSFCVFTNNWALNAARVAVFGNQSSRMQMPLDLSKYSYDEDGTLPASDIFCNLKEPFAIVEEPCGAGFRYVGLATREEYEKYKRENPCCYG